MRCAKAREHLSDQRDEQLGPDQIGHLDRHLDSCTECREYKADLALGSRLIAATEPELPANFEWKLQLKLNQTLQEAAGDAAYPWQEENADRW
jgi:predicted anti-sigma-YlaC factor YlaD